MSLPACIDVNVALACALALSGAVATLWRRVLQLSEAHAGALSMALEHEQQRRQELERIMAEVRGA